MRRAAIDDNVSISDHGFRRRMLFSRPNVKQEIYGRSWSIYYSQAIPKRSYDCDKSFATLKTGLRRARFTNPIKFIFIPRAGILVRRGWGDEY